MFVGCGEWKDRHASVCCARSEGFRFGEVAVWHLMGVAWKGSSKWKKGVGRKEGLLPLRVTDCVDDLSQTPSDVYPRPTLVPLGLWRARRVIWRLLVHERNPL